MPSIDLSYAGRLSKSNAAHAAIPAATVDDPVTLERSVGKWMIFDGKGCPLGRMAGTWAPPEESDLVSGKVGATLRWRKSDNEERYQTHIKHDEWESGSLFQWCARVFKTGIKSWGTSIPA